MRVTLPSVSQTWILDAEQPLSARFHPLFAWGSSKQSASIWFCSHTVHALANPKPLRSQSMASKPWIVRRAVLNERKPPDLTGILDRAD